MGNDNRLQRPHMTFQEHALPGSLEAEGYRLNVAHAPGTVIGSVYRGGQCLGHVELVNWLPREEWHGELRVGLRDAVVRVLEGHARGKQEEDGWHDVRPGPRLLGAGGTDDGEERGAHRHISDAEMVRGDDDRHELVKAESGDLHPETPPGFHAEPQGSHVTAPHQTYPQAAAAKPRGAQAPGGARSAT